MFCAETERVRENILLGVHEVGEEMEVQQEEVEVEEEEEEEEEVEEEDEDKERGREGGTLEGRGGEEVEV